MTTQYIQYEDNTKKKIVSSFGNPQDANVYPNQGEVEEDDPLWIAFITPIEVGELDPIDKLKAFLVANPDVAAIL